jgi:hypothetical protein
VQRRSETLPLNGNNLGSTSLTKLEHDHFDLLVMDEIGYPAKYPHAKSGCMRKRSAEHGRESPATPSNSAIFWKNPEVCGSFRKRGW